MGQESGFNVVWYRCLKAFYKFAINMLAGTVVLSEGLTEGGPLPNSLARLLVGFRSLLVVGRSSSSVLCHIGISMGEFSTSFHQSK